MNEKLLKEWEEKENQFLKEWENFVGEESEKFICDGVVNPKVYWNQKVKLLFLLKEVNGGKKPEKKWDLRKYLRNGGRAQTWNNIARWIIGINNLDKDILWNELDKITDNQRKESLQQIAAINVKKYPGGYTSDNKQISAAAANNGKRLKAQIDLCQPDIVICGGTGDVYCKSITEDKDIEWKKTSRGIWYAIECNKRIIIDYSHPEARVKKCLLYYGLVDAVKEIMNIREILTKAL